MFSACCKTAIYLKSSCFRKKTPHFCGFLLSSKNLSGYLAMLSQYFLLNHIGYLMFSYQMSLYSIFRQSYAIIVSLSNYLKTTAVPLCQLDK